MKILVTGASGFIGRNFLLSCPSNWQVVALYNQSKDFQQWVNQHSLKQVRAKQINLLDDESVKQLIKEYDFFDASVYLAANGDPAWSDHYPADDLLLNTVMLVKLLEKVRFGHFIYFSSGAVYDGQYGPVNPSTPANPKLPYAISKLASEKYVNHFAHKGIIQTPVVIRFFGAYGLYEAPRKIYGKLVKHFGIEGNSRFKIKGDGKNKIDAMYIDDTIRAIHLLIADNNPPNFFDLGSGNPVSITELVNTAARTFGLQPEIIYEGAVPEYIQFYTTDDTFQKQYQFRPVISLQEGLLMLYQKLKH